MAMTAVESMVAVDSGDIVLRKFLSIIGEVRTTRKILNGMLGGLFPGFEIVWK